MLAAPKLTRRQAIQISTLSLIQYLLGGIESVNALDDRPAYCYLGESGWCGPHVDFFIGNLLTKIPEDHKREIFSIRANTNYRSVLRYRSTDHFKVPYAKEIIRYFLEQDEMKFHGFKVKFVSDWPDISDERYALYFGMYKKLLIKSGSNRATRIMVHTQTRTTTGRDEIFWQFLKTELGVPEIRRVRGRNDDLTQLVGFFTGLMRDERELESEAKKSLFSYLRESLNVESLDEMHLGEHPKFNVRNLLV
jgi:hypothetical protein